MTELDQRRRISAAKSTHSGFVGADSEAAIWMRLIRPERDVRTAEAARSILAMGFDEHDKARLHELVARNQDDALSLEEREELENYLRVARVVDLMHSIARRSLKQLPDAG